MCLTQVGTVVATLPGECLVDVDGTRRRLFNLLADGPMPGDRVMVGLGRVLARLTPEEALAAEALHAQLAAGPGRGEP